MYVLQHSVKHLDEILIVRDTNEITEFNINLKYTHTHTLYAYTCTFMYIYISVWYTWIHIHVCLFKCVFIHTYTIYGCIYGLRDTIQRECFIHLVRGYRLGIYCFFFHKGKCFSLLPVMNEHVSVRSYSNSHRLWCDASDQNCFSKINKSITDYDSDPTSCLAHPFRGKGSSLGALAPPPPLLAANTQLFGYLSGASIKGCHSASQFPWTNQIRAPDHTQPSPRCSPPAMLITFKYSHRWSVLSWEKRRSTRGN